WKSPTRRIRSQAALAVSWTVLRFSFHKPGVRSVGDPVNRLSYCFFIFCAVRLPGRLAPKEITGFRFDPAIIANPLAAVHSSRWTERPWQPIGGLFSEESCCCVNN